MSPRASTRDEAGREGDVMISPSVVDEAGWAAYRAHSTAPNTSIVETAEARWLLTGVDYEGFNGVLWAAPRAEPHPPAPRQPSEGDIHPAVARLLRPFRAAGRPMLWHIGPTSTPEDLADALVAAGLRHYEDEPGMVADLAELPGPPPAPVDLTIQTVADLDDMRAWVRIHSGAPAGTPVEAATGLRAACGLGADPPTTHLLGLLDGVPVACAAVHTGRRAAPPPTAAWIEHVVTAAPARRRGIGAAVTYACLAVARGRGLPAAALTSSPDGHGVYRGLGFRDVCTVSRYHWAPPRPPSEPPAAQV